MSDAKQQLSIAEFHALMDDIESLTMQKKEPVS